MIVQKGGSSIAVLVVRQVFDSGLKGSGVDPPMSTIYLQASLSKMTPNPYLLLK